VSNKPNPSDSRLNQPAEALAESAPAEPVQAGRERRIENNSQKKSPIQASEGVIASLALIDAALDGNLGAVRRLLPQADVSVRNLTGLNALEAAIRRMETQCLLELAPHFDVKEANGEGRTPLMLAALRGWAEGVKILLPQSDAKAVDRQGRDALMAAAFDHDDTCVRLLLPHSDARAVAKDGMTALIWAAGKGAQTVPALLPASDPLAASDEGITALMAAASGGREEAAKRLLPFSNPWAMDREGKTALDHAHADYSAAHAKATASEKTRRSIAEMIRARMSEIERDALWAAVAQVEPATRSNDNEAARRAPKSL